MKKLGILGVTLLTASALWASDAEITLNRVQQRYPWNGMVDIDFTVVGVDNPTNYYVQFKLTPSDGADALTLREFVDDSNLYNPASREYRVTWNSAWEDSEYRFISKQAKLQAELVYCNGDKSKAPYGCRYMVVDLSSTNGPYTVEEKTIYGQDAANSFFNTDEYKTTKLAFRRIRANTFMMGAPKDEPGFEAYSYSESGSGAQKLRWLRETQHQVTLTANYLIGVFPLTRTQYDILEGINTNRFTEVAKGMGAKGEKEVSWDSLRGSDALPKPGVVSEGSTLYKLNSRVAASGSPLKFDLPTESQWECACRAGTTGAIYTNVDHMVLDDMRAIAVVRPSDGNTTITPVGSKAANPWGLYDMLGMVREICLDLFKDEDHDWGSNSRVDPLDSEAGSTIVLRGGSYGESTVVTNTVSGGVYAAGLGTWRSAARSSGGKDWAANHVGCRLACTLQ